VLQHLALIPGLVTEVMIQHVHKRQPRSRSYREQYPDTVTDKNALYHISPHFFMTVNRD
jgi:hypothetical protein